MKVTLSCPKCQFENPENTKYCGNCATPLPLSDDTLEAQTETLVVPIADMRTGSILVGRYEIIEELGKGGMGKVYKALDREINEKIAVKIIRPEIATNKKIIERFHNELKMARTITHKNVCRMHDLGKDGDTRFITMEYVSGEDLKKSIRRMGPLTVRKTLSIGKQICQGLSEAHHLGVYHRDLKPHNIMIDREGNAKIMDFGIALSQKANGITDSNIIIGTPQYLSPEQVEGKMVDQRADIYSLGVILFEMVTGQVPFDGDTTLSIAVKHKTEIPRDPKEFNAQIPEELSQLILKCMEKEPEKRYQTAEELCSELTLIESEIPTSETAVSREASKLKTIITRLKLSRFPAALLLLILIAALGYFIYTQIFVKGSRDTTSPVGTKHRNSVILLLLRDLSPNRDQDASCVGMTERLIMNLIAFDELRVIGLESALAYRDSKKSVQEIGRELQVNNVLEGTLKTDEDNINVTIKISSVEDGSVFWGREYQRSSEDVFRLQDDISKSVAEVLGIERVNEKYSKVKPRESVSLRAYESYKYGRHFELRYYESKDKKDLEACEKNYLDAIKKDPNYALAYWRLGNFYYNLYVYNQEEKYFDLMYEYFMKAKEIDENLAEVNVGLGWYRFDKKDNDGAFQYFKRAYELDPNNAEINFHVGGFLRSIGLYDKAIKYYSQAFELEPTPSEFADWNIVRARCYSFNGQYEEAANYLEKAIEIKPDPELSLEYAKQLIMLKRFGDAEFQISKAEKLSPDDPLIRHLRAWIFAAKGEKSKALELIEDSDTNFLYRFTCIYALLGMKNEAITNIQLGIERSFEMYRDYLYSYPYLKSTPCLDNLRDDSRFQEIVNIEKQKYDEKLKKYRGL
ncbi:MAG: protein kinase [Candidatus Aminicenantaceae bacterium]